MEQPEQKKTPEKEQQQESQLACRIKQEHSKRLYSTFFLICFCCFFFQEGEREGRQKHPKYSYKLFQSPSVKTAGLNKSPRRILRSSNRRHAFLALNQKEKQTLNVKLKIKNTKVKIKRVILSSHKHYFS